MRLIDFSTADVWFNYRSWSNHVDVEHKIKNYNFLEQFRTSLQHHKILKELHNVKKAWNILKQFESRQC